MDIKIKNADGTDVDTANPLSVSYPGATGVSATATIAAQNTFSSSVAIRGDFNFSLSGTWVGVTHLQRSFDSGSTWLDVAAYAANIEDVGFEPEAVLYRFGVKTGNYTSGSVVGRISK